MPHARRPAPAVAIPLLALLALLLLSGCGAAPRTDGPEPDNWVLVSGTGTRGALPLRPGDDVTLTVTDDRVNGKAACNSYGGRLSRTDGGGFTITGGLSLTEMACADRRLMDLESLYVNALVAVRSAQATGDRLVLRGDGVELTFAHPAPVQDAPVEGTAWTLDTIVRGSLASSVRLDRPAPTLLLDAGTLSGFTGCRSLAGRYTLTGSRLTTTALQTRGPVTGTVPCPGTGTDDPDHLILKALTAGADVAVHGRFITLTAGPDLQLRYRADSPTTARPPSR